MQVENLHHVTAQPGKTTVIDALKRTTWNAFFGTQLTYGPSAHQAISGIVRRLKANRIFLITDEVLQEAGLVDHVSKAIRQKPVELNVFTGGEISPSIQTVESSAKVAREFAPDLIVAVGGGSNMDLAKAVSAVLTNDCDVESIVGINQVSASSIPLVCLPTTSGTGSEVSHECMLTDSATAEKRIVLSQSIRPDIAIVDPYLTIDCPPGLTAESGIVALAHAVEALLATNFYQLAEETNGDLPYEGNNPFGDMFAERAIQLVGKNLKKAVEVPEDLSARAGMSLAATLAGIAVSNCGSGIVRTLAHAISAASDQCTHGTGNGILLPEVMRLMKAQRPGRIGRIAELLGADCAGMPADEAADLAIDTVKKFVINVGLPHALQEVGITKEQLPQIAAAAVASSQQDNADGLEILKASF